jgi:hypothetical protein
MHFKRVLKSLLHIQIHKTSRENNPPTTFKGPKPHKTAAPSRSLKKADKTGTADVTNQVNRDRDNGTL